jgi:geranylgeranyl diphosphate synthase, type II
MSTPGAGTDAVSDLLASYGDLARRVAIAALPSRAPRRPLYDILAGYLARGGKGLRPALCIATCRALGGSVEDALPFAVSIELLHAAFLVHDDIEDESEMRRGRPTMHMEYGIPLALNAGDALGILAAQQMAKAARSLGRDGAGAVTEFHRVAQDAVEGQAMELGWRRSGFEHVSESDYLTMVLKKTVGYTTILPLRFGALAALGRLPECGRFEPFGFYLGALFQVRDDLLNLWPGPNGIGKERGEDITEGKPTLMTIHVRQHITPDLRGRFLNVLGYGRGGRSIADIEWVIELMERFGSRQHALTCAAGLAGAAFASFQDAFATVPQSPDRDFVVGLVGLLRTEW